jgi:hypothetical protein
MISSVELLNRSVHFFVTLALGLVIPHSRFTSLLGQMTNRVSSWTSSFDNTVQTIFGL